LFCDKTGTLTKNELVFRALSVDGKIVEGVPREIKAKMDLGEKAKNLWRCISLCHDVIKVNIDGKEHLSGASQDELVMLECL
jgi:magnesium-transporting ATPase (P-type)